MSKKANEKKQQESSAEVTDVDAVGQDQDLLPKSRQAELEESQSKQQGEKP